MDVAGNGPAAGPTNVPLELPRSSTNQRVPSVVSCACRRLTPGSDERSISGWVFLLVETRPSRTLRWRSGMIVGSPGDGHGSSASWVWYQSGSTHTSASHSNGSVDSPPAVPAGACTAGPPEATEAADGAAPGAAPGAPVAAGSSPDSVSSCGSVSTSSPGVADGSRGIAPVVKS